MPAFIKNKEPIILTEQFIFFVDQSYYRYLTIKNKNKFLKFQNVILAIEDIFIGPNNKGLICRTVQSDALSKFIDADTTFESVQLHETQDDKEQEDNEDNEDKEDKEDKEDNEQKDKLPVPGKEEGDYVMRRDKNGNLSYIRIV